MGKCKVLVISLVAFSLISVQAQATLVSFEADTFSSWSPAGAVIMQGITSSGSTGITMTAESHSTFSVNLTAVNDTTFTWTGYRLDLDPAGTATFVPNSAGSTVFNDVDYISLYRLEFSNGEVLITKPVAFQFDVDIPDIGQHTFTLTQTPIPEPATVALLGLGTLGLFLRRREG